MKQNKNLIILLLVAVIGIVGVTIAYFSSRATFKNVFETPEYGTTYIEKFISPDNWLPGDETEKTLEVRNSGNVNEAVRVKVEERWVSKNGTTLSLTQGDNVVAQINFINGNDWTKVEVDGENYYYYYYNYKLTPGETTSKLLDKVTFNPAITSTATCSDTVVDGVTTRVCNSNKEGYDGATYTLMFTIETVQYNKYQEAWNTNVAIAEEKPHPGTLTLLEKTNPVSVTNYADGDIHEMYTFEHEATAQTPVQTDYRYIGNDPYNYVYFNCDDLNNQNSDTCEVWRIIGVFDVEREVDDEENPGEKKTITETRMKIVKGKSLGSSMAWNSSSDNNWNNASLKIFLNTQYYNQLKDNARLMIEDAKFYLGQTLYRSDSEYGTTDEIYSWERGNDLYWIGEIALMYASDRYMAYGKGANDFCYQHPDDCRTDGWTRRIYSGHSWLLNRIQNDKTSVMATYQGGFLNHSDPKMTSYYVNPALYLSANVKIIDGTGQSTDPYKLSL
ncbi:MAG: hypothetical protein IJR82_03050 [Bacilli bacterium]|nr:hypothetical protein [Bacilli bacterium]